MPLGTDATRALWHVLAYILHQSLRHLQAAKDLAFRDLAIASKGSLGVPTLLVHLITFIISNDSTHNTAADHLRARMFLYSSPSCKIPFLIQVSRHLIYLLLPVNRALTNVR
jgi:hypothetical protein